MNYRLSRKELRIIEQTKKEGTAPPEEHGESPAAQESTEIGTWSKIRPYVYFAAIFIVLAITIKLMIYFTA